MIELRRPHGHDVHAIETIERGYQQGVWSTTSLLAYHGRSSTRAWVAVQRDQVVGHVIANVAADVGEIITVAVHRHALRQGVAARLMRAARADWLRAHVTEAFLEVAEHNAAARALYTHLGWNDVGRRKSYYKDGSHAIIMRLQVATSPSGAGR